MTTETQVNTLKTETTLTLNTIEGARSLWKLAESFSGSTILPKDFQGNIANCVIALDMASRMNASPMQVAQNIYIVHGRPSWSAKFLIATFNQCGRFSAIKYEFSGTENNDDYGCRAYATEKATGEVVRGPLITIAIAKKEGWYAKSGSKWQTMPEQMLRYRAAAWFVNTVAPELAMGLPTADEVADFTDAEIIEPFPRAAAKPQTQLVEWEISDLEDFDELLEQAHVLFVDAGSAGYFESFAAPWRKKRGRGDATEAITALHEAVCKLMPVEDTEAEEAPQEVPQEAQPTTAPSSNTTKGAGAKSGAPQPLMDTHGA